MIYFRLLMIVIAMETCKSWTQKFSAKSWRSESDVYVNADIESLKCHK